LRGRQVIGEGKEQKPAGWATALPHSPKLFGGLDLDKKVTEVAEDIALALKSPNATKLLELIEEWFFSDLDIDFSLKKGEEILWCTFESDAYYYKGKRYQGNFRRFVAKEGSDQIFNEIEHLTKEVYDKEGLKRLVKELAEVYEIMLLA
jgi:hypothetical protein